MCPSRIVTPTSPITSSFPIATYNLLFSFRSKRKCCTLPRMAGFSNENFKKLSCKNGSAASEEARLLETPRTCFFCGGKPDFLGLIVNFFKQGASDYPWRLKMGTNEQGIHMESIRSRSKTQPAGSALPSAVPYLPHVHIALNLRSFLLVTNKRSKFSAFENWLCCPDT